jgi:hypothetical protein
VRCARGDGSESAGGICGFVEEGAFHHRHTWRRRSEVMDAESLYSFEVRHHHDYFLPLSRNTASIVSLRSPHPTL